MTSARLAISVMMRAVLGYTGPTGAIGGRRGRDVRACRLSGPTLMAW